MSRGLQLYAWGLGVAGAAALGTSLPLLGLDQLVPVLGWVLLAGIFQRYRIVLPNRLNFSFGSTFVLLAFLDQGTAAGLVVVSVAGLVTALQAKRLVQKVFNFGQLVVSLFVAAGVAVWVGRGAEVMTLLGSVSALVSALTYFTVNTTLIAVVIRLSSRRPFRDFLPDLLKESYMGVLSGVGLLIPLFLAFRTGGWVTLGVVSVGMLGFRYAVQLYLEQKRVHLDTLEQLGSLVERKSGAAENHALAVARLSRSVAEALKFRPADVETIYAAGLLHDIGEAEVDPRVVSVMTRRAIPTLQDLQAYRQHPVLGEQTVASVKGMSPVASLVRFHHEAWDGSGYPDGLRGTAIPLGARILGAVEAVVEAGSTLEERLTALPRLAGTVIDPSLAGPLERALKAEATGEHRPTPTALAEARASDLQRKLIQELRSSQLMEAVGAGRFLSYRDGSFLNFMGVPAVPPAPEEMAHFAERCLVSQLPMRERIVHGGRAYDVYGLPTEEGHVRLLLFDLTEALAVEREQTRQIFRAYRDVLSAATGGKVTLLDEESWVAEAESGELLWELELSQLADGAEARMRAEESTRPWGLSAADRFGVKLSIAEAVTNVFKHAGRGSVSARLFPGTLRFIVRDDGDGIPYDILPQALLIEGYSTKRSMGKGFSVILRYADRLLLRTSGAGTVLIIDKHLESSSTLLVKGEGTHASSGVAEPRDDPTAAYSG